MHAGDPPRQVQVGLDAVEGGLVGRRDEDRVDPAVAGARLGGQRVAGAGHGLSGKGKMDVVDVERMQPRDAVERTCGGGHQLRADTVTGEAGNGLRVVHCTHSLVDEGIGDALLP